MSQGVVFLDSVGLIALWNADDQWHAPATAAFGAVMIGRRPVITTSFILLECGNAAARKPFRSKVAAFRQGLALRRELIVPTEEDWIRAWAAYDRGEAGHAGIVDHVSFVVMRRLGIAEAFTNDRHFQAAGFTTLL